MIIHKIIRRGSDHSIFTEDFLSVKETSNFVYGGIFDGCSNGKDSHFASTLFAKAFNDVLNNLGGWLNNTDTSLESNAKFLIYHMARKVRDVKVLLNLKTDELLSTIIICIVNKETKECYIAAFGDGYFRVDDVEVIIKNTKYLNEEEGENMPDYIAYDLDSLQNFNDFEQWYAGKTEIHKFETSENISIASDGIDTFKIFKDCPDSVNAIDFLVKDEIFSKTVNPLDRKYNVLRSKYGMANKDDLSLISIKFN